MFMEMFEVINQLLEKIEAIVGFFKIWNDYIFFLLRSCINNQT